MGASEHQIKNYYFSSQLLHIKELRRQILYFLNFFCTFKNAVKRFASVFYMTYALIGRNIGLTDRAFPPLDSIETDDQALSFYLFPSVSNYFTSPDVACVGPLRYAPKGRSMRLANNATPLAACPCSDCAAPPVTRPKQIGRAHV